MEFVAHYIMSLLFDSKAYRFIVQVIQLIVVQCSIEHAYAATWFYLKTFLWLLNTWDRTTGNIMPAWTFKYKDRSAPELSTNAEIYLRNAVFMCHLKDIVDMGTKE